MTLVDTETGEIIESRTEKASRLDETVHRGVAAFIEVGCALIAIKTDKLYVELGHTTFDAYCTERHAIGHSHRARLMVAATIATELLDDSAIGEIPAPTSERQIRALAQLPDETSRREAWLDALDSAGGQPSHADVAAAVVAQLSPMGETRGTTIEDLVEAGATVTVKPNTRPWSQSELPSMPAPDPPEPVSEVDEHSKSIDRRVKRLQMFCSSLHEFRKLATCVDRDEVLARLAPSDLDIVLRAEKEITWTT